MRSLLPVAARLVVGVILAVLGYLLGVRKSRLERISERRDNAIADIFGAMVQHSRDCITWAGVGRDAEWEESVKDSYEEFLRCFYTRSIWLKPDARDLINAYAKVARVFYVKVRNEMNNAGSLADGTKVTMPPVSDRGVPMWCIVDSGHPG